MEDEDIYLEPRSSLGRRAKRTLQRSVRLTVDDMFETVHKPLMQKSWEKVREAARYNYRRKQHEHLAVIHAALVTLPQDVIYIVQEKAGMMAQALPLPKVIRVRTVSSYN